VAGACGWLLISIECQDQLCEIVLPLFHMPLWLVLSATALTSIVALYDFPSPKAVA
jgi:hypothetical protein